MLSKNRYKHIPVRFSQAIHGLRNFWTAIPDPPLLSAGLTNAQPSLWQTYSKLACRGWERLSKNLRSHGWRSRSATGMCRRSVFWKDVPNLDTTPKLPARNSVRTNRTARIFGQLHFTPLHLPGIEDEQTAYQRLADTADHFDGFHGLGGADHAHQWGYHTRFGAG